MYDLPRVTELGPRATWFLVQCQLNEPCCLHWTRWHKHCLLMATMKAHLCWKFSKHSISSTSLNTHSNPTTLTLFMRKGRLTRIEITCPGSVSLWVVTIGFGPGIGPLMVDAGWKSFSKVLGVLVYGSNTSGSKVPVTSFYLKRIKKIRRWGSEIQKQGS